MSWVHEFQTPLRVGDICCCRSGVMVRVVAAVEGQELARLEPYNVTNLDWRHYPKDCYNVHPWIGQTFNFNTDHPRDVIRIFAEKGQLELEYE